MSLFYPLPYGWWRVALKVGLLPVSLESLRAAGHMEGRVVVVGSRTTAGKDVILSVDDTRFAFLSDTIVTPPIPRTLIISVGDVLTCVGLIYSVQAAMRRRPWP